MRHAQIRTKLGIAYVRLAEVRDEEANLKQAFTAFGDALRIFTSDSFPQDYARTQNDLGSAYVRLAEVRDQEANLKEAIGAFGEALRIFTSDSLPHDYASVVSLK